MKEIYPFNKGKYHSRMKTSRFISFCITGFTVFFSFFFGNTFFSGRCSLLAIGTWLHISYWVLSMYVSSYLCIWSAPPTPLKCIRCSQKSSQRRKTLPISDYNSQFTIFHPFPESHHFLSEKNVKSQNDRIQTGHLHCY